MARKTRENKARMQRTMIRFDFFGRAMTGGRSLALEDQALCVNVFACMQRCECGCRRCVYVCKREGDREGGIERETDKERQRQTETHTNTHAEREV